MELTTCYFDLWLFHKSEDICRYLLLKTSQEKADKWFNSARFWQIPTDKVSENENIENAAKRLANSLGLSLTSLWAVEHVYTIYNHRRRDISIIPAFAGEVANQSNVELDWEHSEYSWVTEKEALEKLTFQGLIEGLTNVEKMITSRKQPPGELRLL